MVTLSAAQARAKELVYDRGVCAKDAADMLKVEESTIREHLKRTRRKYREAGQPLPDNRRSFVLN